MCTTLVYPALYYTHPGYTLLYTTLGYPARRSLATLPEEAWLLCPESLLGHPFHCWSTPPETPVSLLVNHFWTTFWTTSDPIPRLLHG